MSEHDEPEYVDNISLAELTDDTEEADEELSERVDGQYFPYALSPLLYLVTPFFIGFFLSPPVATTTLLIVFGIGSFLLGIIDGGVFQFTWAYGIVSGIFYMIADLLYFNDGAWIYVAPVVVLTIFGSWIGAHISPQPHEPEITENTTTPEPFVNA